MIIYKCFFAFFSTKPVLNFTCVSKQARGAKIAEEFFMLTAIDCINISIGPDVKRGD